MMARKTRVAAFALCAAAFCCSCHRKKPPTPVMVPPTVTVRVPEQLPPPPPTPPDLPPSKTGTTVAPPPVVTETKMPGPPKRKQRTAKKTRKTDTSVAQAPDTQTAAATTTPVSTASAPDTTSTQVPQLGQMLTDRQRHDYEVRIHDALERARANLGKARSRARLTDPQQHMAAQVETFIAQAEERRKTDLVSSRSLAERADLLARDLAESLQ